MDSGIISSRYARALLAYATAHRAASRVYTDTEALSNSFRHYPALDRVLANRTLTAAKKKQVLTAASGGEGCSAEFSRFLSLVIDRGREELLRTICLDYREMVRAREGIMDAGVTTATALDEATKGKLLARLEELTGRKVRLHTAVDPALVGGYILRWDTYRLDASARGRLEKIRKQLIQKL